MGVSGTSSPWWWGTAGSVMSGRCVELRDMSPRGREMATSAGEREECQARTFDNFVGAPLLSSTTLNLLGMEFTRAAQVVAGILFHSTIMTSRSCWMLDTWSFSTFRLRTPHICSKGFKVWRHTWPLHHFHLQQQGSCHLGGVCHSYRLVSLRWQPEVTVSVNTWLVVFVLCHVLSPVYCLSPPILLPNYCFSGSTCVSLVTLVCLPI